MKVVITGPALKDVAATEAYISKISVLYARRTAKKLLTAARALAKMPLKGRPVPEFLGTDLRQWIASNHRIIYRVDEAAQTIIVYRFFQVKRLLNESDIQP